jgi:hypothetical protein
LVRHINKDESGQSALFDAVIYLVIMIVASSLIAVYASQYLRDVELSQNQDMMDYCRDTSEVIMGATLNSTWYEDINGEIVQKPPGDTTVLNLLLEELYLLDDGVPEENFALGFEKDITILARNLVLPNYHFVLTANYDDLNSDHTFLVVISDIKPHYETKEEVLDDDTDYSKTIPDDNLVTVQMTFPMMGKQGEAAVSFSLWM